MSFVGPITVFFTLCLALWLSLSYVLSSDCWAVLDRFSSRSLLEGVCCFELHALLERVEG